MFSKIKKYLNDLNFINNTFTFIFNINFERNLKKIWQESLPNLSFYVISQACFYKA